MEKEILQLMEEFMYKPMTVNELEEALGIEDAEEFRDLVRVLNQLEREGRIVLSRAKRYGLPERMNLVRGRLQGNAKGFGFVIPDDPEHPDIYIHGSEMQGAMHGDTVLARVNRTETGKGLEGEIVRIVKRAQTQVVGTYQDAKYFGFVVPDDPRISKDIFIPKEKRLGAIEGHKVVVKITNYGEEKRNLEGEIIEILGHKNDPGVDILSIIRNFNLPGEFPKEVMDEANQTPDEILPSELEGRKDLRDHIIVTIDGADAKDLDDAISLEKLENGHFRLGVHIADVSYYVQEGSQLDREAYERGTSVYLVDRVIPMIPHRLSNGICSLNPNVDRLTLTCEMEFNSHGVRVGYDIYPSVIRSTKRMTYYDVNRILVEQDDEIIEKHKELVPLFQNMEELSNLIRQRRTERGAINFEFQEAKILVDEEGKPFDIDIRERNVGEMLIEDFMLAANEAVAEHFHWLQLPFIYRIHEDPDPAKMQSFLEFITNFGYVVRGVANQVHPRALQQILDEIQDMPEEMVISTVLLRSLKQARYSVNNEGHFGLSAEFYTHFTAPIRRYPDLMVHRLIRKYHDGYDEDLLEELRADLDDICKYASERERLAVEAEREVDALKMAEYMQDHIGEEFEGIVSSVTSFGMFVKLPNTIEGLVHVSYLTDDYYHFHEKQYMLIGKRTGKTFRIGDAVKVRCFQVNMDEKTIDFELIESQNGRMKAPKRGPKVIIARKEKGGTRGTQGAHGKQKKSSGQSSKQYNSNGSKGNGKNSAHQPYWKGVKKKRKRK